MNIGPGDRTDVFDLVAQYPFDFEPGYGQIYNNSAYMLIGHIIERASGQSYEELSRRARVSAGKSAQHFVLQ